MDRELWISRLGGPLLASLSPIVRPIIGAYFDTDADSSSEARHDEARRHPVFILSRA
jgi:hypothetical protein